jgi:hypothetical protein
MDAAVAHGVPHFLVLGTEAEQAQVVPHAGALF